MLQLPDAVLVLILQQLPQQERLSQCALVSQAWAAAARAATAAISFNSSEQPQQVICEEAKHSLQHWLDQNSHQIVRSLATKSSCSLRQVPRYVLWYGLDVAGDNSREYQMPAIRMCFALACRYQVHCDGLCMRVLQVQAGWPLSGASACLLAIPGTPAESACSSLEAAVWKSTRSYPVSAPNYAVCVLHTCRLLSQMCICNWGGCATLCLCRPLSS